MASSADPDQLASSETVCIGRVYPGSVGQGLIQDNKNIAGYIGKIEPFDENI